MAAPRVADFSKLLQEHLSRVDREARGPHATFAARKTSPRGDAFRSEPMTRAWPMVLHWEAPQILHCNALLQERPKAPCTPPKMVVQSRSCHRHRFPFTLITHFSLEHKINRYAQKRARDAKQENKKHP